MAGIDDPVSFIFGGNTGIPTYEELKRRRAAAVAGAARQARPFPKNLGEGLTALGEAVGSRVEEDRLNQAERALESKNAAEVERVRGIGAAPARTSEVVDPTATRDNITAALLSPPGVAPVNPTVPGPQAPTTDMPVQPTSTGGGLSPDILARRGGIGGIESGGTRDPYTVLGAVTPKGDRAYGKYQMMGANIPEWSQAALGRTLTPQQLLADKDAQDTIFDHRFGNYVNKYGEEGAARAWYGGERGMRNLNATDQHGRLTVGGYGQDYLRRLRGAQGGTETSGALPPGGGDVGATSTIDTETGNPPTPTDIRPAPVRVAGGPTTIGPAAATVNPASTPEDEYVRPKPVPPALPVRTPETQRETVARRVLSTMSADPDNPQRRALMNIVKEDEDKRAFQDAREITRYNAEIQHYSAEDTAWKNEQAGLAAKRDETRKRRGELTAAETTRALEARLGGRKVEDFVKDFKGEHGEANKQIAALTGINEAENAIKAGAITGAGRGFRVNLERAKAYLGSDDADRLATASQIMEATLKSTLAIALAKIQAGDPKVTNNDLLVAQGMVGTPDMQRAAILKLMSLAKEEAHDRINAFEERRHQKVGGTPLEGDFAVTMRPIASPDKVKILLDNKDDANVVAHFNRTYGPGAAKLELDRARRAEEARRR